MPGFFRKAMGLFVEFEDSPGNSFPKSSAPHAPPGRITSPQVLNSEEFDKFENHFERLFDQANLPGPDYYEFMRMNETLESHIKDDKARLAATFASLSIQGLTKETLITTADRYKDIINEDRTKFERTAREKSEHEIGGRRQELAQFEDTVRKNAEVIEKLTQEINEAQKAINGLTTSIGEEEKKLEKNRQGYLVACEAMMMKIDNDIQKIKNNL
jgi:chromosome segregation ATPase